MNEFIVAMLIVAAGFIASVFTWGITTTGHRNDAVDHGYATYVVDDYGRTEWRWLEREEVCGCEKETVTNE